MAIPVSGRFLIEVLDRLVEVPEDATLYAATPWSAASPTCGSDDDGPPAGFDYLLEAELARQVISVWSRWRDERKNATSPMDTRRTTAPLLLDWPHPPPFGSGTLIAFLNSAAKPRAGLLRLTHSLDGVFPAAH